MSDYTPPKTWPLPAARLKITCVLSAVLLSLSSCESEIGVASKTDFDGIYTVEEAKVEDHYLLTLRKKADKANAFTIVNLANMVKDTLEATASGDKLTISAQAFTNYLGYRYTISGEGVMNGERLILHYTIEGYNGYSGAVFAKKQVDGK